MLLDADIREPLFDFLEETYGRSRIIEEKQIRKSRADVFMITGDALFGVEIKSDADTYVRLERQVPDYDRFFDYNIVAVGSKHAFHIGEHVPEHWGIITVEEAAGKPDFYFYRKPKLNPKAKFLWKLRLLWRMELAQLQALNDMPKYAQRSKDFVVKSMIERTKYPEGKKGRIPPELLQRQICAILLERDYTTVEEQIQTYKTAVQCQKERRKGK